MATTPDEREGRERDRRNRERERKRQEGGGREETLSSFAYYRLPTPGSESSSSVDAATAMEEATTKGRLATAVPHLNRIIDSPASFGAARG